MFFDFSTSFVFNSAIKSINQWRTTCLSIVVDTDDIANPLVLSAECFCENVPFADLSLDKSLFMPNSLYPFQTISRGSNWYMARNLSVPHLVDPFIIPDRKYLPYSSSIQNFSDITLTTCDLSLIDELSQFNDRTSVYPSIRGGKSLLSLTECPSPAFFAKASTSSFIEDVQNFFTSRVSLNCSFVLPGSRSQITSPVRYINFAPDYLQIISGTVAFSPDLAGRYCIALNSTSDSALLEFMIEGRSWTVINEKLNLSYSPQIYSTSLSLDDLAIYSS